MTTNPGASGSPPSFDASLNPPNELLSFLSALSLLFKENLGKPETSQWVPARLGIALGRADVFNRDLGRIVQKLNIQLNSYETILPPTSIRELVNSLGEDYERWCLLEADTFTVITRTLLRARNCLERDQVLETLTDRVEARVMESDTVKDYKDTVGEGSISGLLSFFTEEENLDFTRRWVGLLLVELLDGSELNRERLLKTEKKQLEELGDIIERGTDRMLKIVAGKIIWQTVRSSSVMEGTRERLKIFWAQDSIDFSKDFPMEPGTQWDGGFAQFVTRLEEDLDDPDIGLFPIAFNAYQVRLGERKPQVFGRGAVSISIGELFSIYIPPNSDDSCEWIDLKITNITRIEPINEAVPGDLKGQLRYLKLHLSDPSNSGYLYLISMRPSSKFDSIMVSCYAEEADDIVENVERCRGLMLSNKHGVVPHISAVSGLLVNPEISQSQREKEEELQKRRGYVLDAVNSPAVAEATPSGQSESGEMLSINAADLVDIHDGVSSPVVRRSPRVDLPPGARASAQALRPPGSETRPKQIRGAPYDCSPLTSPPASGETLGSPQGRLSDPGDHPVAQTSKGELFTTTECELVESTGLRSLGDTKLSQVNGEPTDGLSRILQRVPALISLEEVKKRGKLKDRLANEQGEIPAPPSLQKQNTGRKRVTAKQPMEPTLPAKTTKSVSRKAKGEGTAKNIKPLVQRKKPEPLPISDDIWELPLSSPVSQGPKAGGRVQKHGRGINKKAKHDPKPGGIVKGRLAAKGKVVPGKRGRGRGRSYKSEAQVVDSSEESTPHSGNEAAGPGVPRAPGEVEAERSALTTQPKTLTKTVRAAQISETQPNLRRSLRERKPPRVVLIPSSGGESERGELVECTPRKALARSLSPGRKPESVRTNKRALPEAYRINASTKKRKDPPIRECIDVPQASDTGKKGVRRGVRVMQLGGKQENFGETRAVVGQISPVAPELVQNREARAVSSKRKAYKRTTAPKELAEGSHKRQRTSPLKTVCHEKRGDRAATFDTSDSPGVSISLSQMGDSLEARDSTREVPGLDGRVADDDDALPLLNKREYINHNESIEEGRALSISSRTEPPEPSAHYPQTGLEVLGSLDDASRVALTNGPESRECRHSSLEDFSEAPLPLGAMDNPARGVFSADVLGTPGLSGSPTALHHKPDLQRSAPAAPVNTSKALAPHPTSNHVDASTSTAGLTEDRTTSTPRPRISGPSPQIAEGTGSTIPKQMSSVTSPMTQLKGKGTCGRAGSVNTVSETAINGPCFLSPIEFSRASSPTGPIVHDTAPDEERLGADDLAQLSATQRLQSLVILSEGDEDIVVWDAKEKKGGFTALQRMGTGHTEVDENGSPSRLDTPKPHTGPRKISWEILNKRRDHIPESSQGLEAEESTFAENTHNIPEGGTQLGGQPPSRQTHIVGARTKGGKPENLKIGANGEGGCGYFNQGRGAIERTDGPESQSVELPKPLEKFREMAKDVISISSTSPSPALPPSLPPKKSHRVCQEPEPWEVSDSTGTAEPAIAKVLQILAKRGTYIPKSSPPVLRQSKSKVQLIRNRKRKHKGKDNLTRSGGVGATGIEDRPFEGMLLRFQGYVYRLLTSSDIVLAEKGYLETHFSKMLRKKRFVRIQKPPYQGSPSDQLLAREQCRRASGLDPTKEERVRRQAWIQDSDHEELDRDTEAEDSISAYTDEDDPDIDTDTYSESESSESGDSEDGDENSQDGEEDSHIVWRKSLPGHLKETLSVLEQITRGLVKYLVRSEELAIGMIEKFEAQGARLIQALGDSHEQEYGEFLDSLEQAKKAVAEKAEELDQVIRNGLDSVERKEGDWRNSRVAKKKQTQRLDSAIEEILINTNN
ncbi:unnamed protein product [Tuber aestivum]|uniref:Uncharacterized protein n=1 Tax=Tuber aestivum TaxID=59557 RepID=A0A292Q733_9PEZI|nr:unnamed protein product [Tuber aestivum]